MTPERVREIRRAAARRAANELNAVIADDFESKTQDDYPDPEERDEFMAAIERIINRLEREALR